MMDLSLVLILPTGGTVLVGLLHPHVNIIDVDQV